MEREVGCWGKVNPPLRYAADVDRLWRGIHDGGVTCLGTDHGTGGRTRAMKEKGGGRHDNIWAARAGIRGGLEHLLPVMMTFGVHRGRISMEDLVRVGSTGALVAGADADVVIVDAEREAVVDEDFYHCLCEVSIYRGWRFRGMARTTLVRGRVMMEDFETVEKPGWGRYVARGPAARGIA
jgi:dihydropyrimidinase/dihydroorotase